MFTQSITQAYDLTDATWEVITMLLGSFILGWLFHYFWQSLADGERMIAPAMAAVPSKYANIGTDDLKIVEGIGPKIEELLKGAGLSSWADVASTEVSRLKEILKGGGDRFQMHDPSSWPDQAALAVEGKWADLEEYQDLLIGGRS
jgi:hypothetical protein